MKLTETFLSQVAFQMVMRPASFDIADDPTLLSRLKPLVDIVDSASNTFETQIPWLPTVSSLRKILSSARIYGIIKKEIHKRKSSGIQRRDALQQMLDDGESTVHILGVCKGGSTIQAPGSNSLYSSC
jgi:sterol 14-demethylase